MNIMIPFRNTCGTQELKLIAISYTKDKMSMSDNDFNDAVEKKYVELLLKQK